MLSPSVTALLAIGLAPLLASAQFRITGAPGATRNNVPSRRNINDLYSEGGPQWDLYIQALSQLQSKDSADPLGYFQISGIHGAPFIEWNHGGARNNNGWGPPPPPFPPPCRIHLVLTGDKEPLFLPWHRPYVLLFEQRLVELAIAIASQYPAAFHDQYLAAANSLRSPFWDWSADSNVPACTVPQTVFIKVPNGQNLTRSEVRNPLSWYDYPSEARDGRYGPFIQAPRTSRCAAPARNPDSANQELQSYGLRQATYDIFATATTFNEFAVSGRVHHLEELHNDVHYSAGCQGQFLDAGVSGFDPLFMLHHTHVDRLWAYWQFIVPSQASFSGSYQGQSRFSTPAGTVIHPNSPLPPFFDRSLRYFTPNSVSSIRGMGYTYEGLEYWRMSAQQLRQSAIQTINSLYAPASAFAKRSGAEAQTRHFAHIELDRNQVQRPSAVTLFIAGKKVTTVPVMSAPAKGILHSSVSIDKVPNESSWNTVEIQISKPDGTTIDVDGVDSLKITIETVSMRLAASRDEFPEIVDSKSYVAKIQPLSEGGPK
ncbi:tyrosinase 2 [Metarhizium album ARSEF 1941]|uniref:Tyrosinase 2 n=1 Tax=Metarhizium album (strain ARSEF 1941) TaxID=1081103 RepID=A0A0B2X1U6_METAS|nr:tyrosinase 2 [Metarhizium album ARSEF 1941]KHN99115.1 tyrosinase 2 [Metarhizium album ARSEF 1941]